MAAAGALHLALSAQTLQASPRAVHCRAAASNGSETPSLDSFAVSAGIDRSKVQTASFQGMPSSLPAPPTVHKHALRAPH